VLKRTELLALAVVMALAPASAQTQVFPALARLDCAPWDGPAFTVALGERGAKKVDPERSWLQISIWHPAESRHGVTYRFPDSDGKTGAISYRGAAFPSSKGTVTFTRTGAPTVIDGSFDLVTPDGRHLTGQFHGSLVARKVLCGM
jgi:hypothetical protein